VIRFLAIVALLALTGCAYQSPGAKVSTVINVSIMPPASVVPTL
jgi:hypothetical protein